MVRNFRPAVCAVLILLIHYPLSASLDLTANATLAWPTGKLRNYSYGSTGVGATVRVSTNLNRFSKIFLQGRILDFGLSHGYIPRDNVYSDSNIESVTDAYIASVYPGLALGTNIGGVIPYCNIFGGMAYYSTLSRISSRDIESIEEFSETSGTSWQMGVGFGVRTIMWEPRDRSVKHLIDSLAFDFRCEYVTGGHLEYLDTRSTRFKNGELLYENVSFNGNLAAINVGFSIRF